MSEIRTLIVKNQFNLPEEKINSLMHGLANRTISYLSPDKEAGPFLLYTTGSSLEEITLKTGYPADIILLTAIYYKWEEKAKALGMSNSEGASREIQKDLLNTLLIATTLSVKRQLGEVIAGRLDPDKVPLIPKNPASLEKLMAMLNALQEVPEAAPQPVQYIQAENVQINQGISGQETKEPIKISSSKSKALEDF